MELENKDLEYWKNNAEEDYLHTPISVLKYITELEEYLSLNLTNDSKDKFNFSNFSIGFPLEGESHRIDILENCAISVKE